MCLWSPLLHGFQGGTHHADDGTRIHLTVEALPCGQGWEWLAWIARDPSRSRHGVASSAAAAQRLAEDAAFALDRRRSPARAGVAGRETTDAGAMPVDRRRTSVPRPRPMRPPGPAAARPGSRKGRLP